MSIENYGVEADHVKYTLTNQEKVILRLIMEDNSDKEIAYLLGCAFGTVKKHVSSILKKMDVSSRTGAAVEAMVDHRWLE